MDRIPSVDLKDFISAGASNEVAQIIVDACKPKAKSRIPSVVELHKLILRIHMEKFRAEIEELGGTMTFGHLHPTLRFICPICAAEVGTEEHGQCPVCSYTGELDEPEEDE